MYYQSYITIYNYVNMLHPVINEFHCHFIRHGDNNIAYNKQ